jgi:hypothetical protein
MTESKSERSNGQDMFEMCNYSKMAFGDDIDVKVP